MGGRRGLRSIQWLRGLREDVGRKAPLYFSDWRDGLTRKSLAAISFLFFACFAPVIAFGGAMGALTGGAMGVSEVLVSCGLSGMAYAALAGQPMTFVGPTGLTLAFTAALYQWCTFMSLPFLPMYAWVGCWTSLMLVVASMANASGLIRYCTRFTEDVFNALLAFNFLSEALRSLATEFVDASRGFLAFDTALITAWLCQTTAAFRNKRYLSAGAREAVSDFGPAAVIVGVTAVSSSSPSSVSVTLRGCRCPPPSASLAAASSSSTCSRSPPASAGLPPSPPSSSPSCSFSTRTLLCGRSTRRRTT